MKSFLWRFPGIRQALLISAGLGIATPAFAVKKSAVSAPAQNFAVSQFPPWMKMDFTLRGRTEAQTAINYESHNTQLYELTRARGGLTIQAPKYFSIYAQFQDAHSPGLPRREAASNMLDAFDLRQAYLKLGNAPFTFYAGRQELRLGHERLVGRSNWSNISRTFDLLHLFIGSENNHVELFSGSVVKVNPTSFDRPEGGFTIHGAYATLATLIPHTNLQPYVLFHTLPVTSQQGLKGRELLVAPGIRAVGKLPSGFDYKVEGVMERGSYVNDSIHAGAGYIKAGYTAASLPWKPHIEPEYDYATGNSHRNPLRVSTFDEFHPSDHNVFGLLDLFSWKNIKQRRLNLDLRPSKKLDFLLQGESLHVANVMDSIYNGGGSKMTVAPPPGGLRSDDIGSEFDASIGWDTGHHVLCEMGVGHLWPGAALTQNNHGAPDTIAYFQLTYKFSISKDGHKVKTIY
ncbi:MAG: alginate export family protein [Terracidiphilus sp.]